MVVLVTGASGQLGQAIQFIAPNYPKIDFIFASFFFSLIFLVAIFSGVYIHWNKLASYFFAYRTGKLRNIGKKKV